ncbi:hypothetical protein SMITH_325 [Smithella sp. ME-1]|nr:hypothetical protein SMITH_325 [Smithella sp. ME-1]
MKIISNRMEIPTAAKTIFLNIFYSLCFIVCLASALPEMFV